MEFQLNTPVTFIIFNRPDVTARSFQEIARVKPKRLLIVADGPRAHVPGEVERCALTRSVVEKIDWDCEVLRNYSDKNLGCRNRVSTGLDWAFQNCEETIIVEDDCLPSQSFFRFCEEMLTRYRDDERMMIVSGNNFNPSHPIPESYYFTRYVHIWGWASWRRAWMHYDVNMALWPKFRERDALNGILKGARSVRHWTRVFERTFNREIDTWDFQLNFAVWTQNGLCIAPKTNLVTNVGFGPEATHTKSINDFANRVAGELQFPLVHPPFVAQNTYADALFQRQTEIVFFKILSRIRGQFHRLTADSTD